MNARSWKLQVRRGLNSLNEVKPTNYVAERFNSNQNHRQENSQWNDTWSKVKPYSKVLLGLGLSYSLWKCTKLKTDTKFGLLDNTSLVIRAAVPTDQSSRRDRFNFIADVVRVSVPAVVSIEQSVNVPALFQQGGRKIPLANGSGFLVDSKGLIITNAHVVGNQSSVTVRLEDGRQFEGRVIAVDETVDVAAVQINANDLPYLNLGDSQQVMAGEWVIAMGSPLRLDNTVTAGIVSNLNRSGEELGFNHQKRNMQYIQTDATINSGNSGGPLINLDGEVIGVNTMMATIGITFAIPSDYIKDFLRRLKEHKNAPQNRQTARPQRRYIGVSMLTLTPDVSRRVREMQPNLPMISSGVYIHKVTPNSPAHHAGLRSGDVIVEANRVKVNESKDIKAMQEYATVTFKVIRGNDTLNIAVTPEDVF